jgi:hypothetical protein
MVTKERLHQLVEVLPEGEVATATRILEALSGLEPGEVLGANGGPGAATELDLDDDRPTPLTPEEARRRFGLPTAVVVAPPIKSIDDLAGDFWPEDEDPDEFDATIRRWRDEDRRG